MASEPPRLDPRELFGALNRHDVRYLLIGMLAAALHGSPLATADADVCVEREPGNLDRLAQALAELDARIRTTDDPRGIPFPHDGAFLGRVDIWNLRTRAGDLDISFQPSGTSGYDDLRRASVVYEIDDLRIPVASLLDVIRSKEAANRPRDRQALPTLRELLAQTLERERRR